MQEIIETKLARGSGRLHKNEGRGANRDFFTVASGALCGTAERYQVFPDPYSVVHYQVEQLGRLLCEQIMSLMENSVPQNTLVPVSFLPSPALGGGPPRQII